MISSPARTPARVAALALATLAYIAPVAAYEVLATPNIAFTADGEVHVIVRQPDGRLLVGGNFSIVDGMPRRGIARLESDGSLDASFDARCCEPNVDLYGAPVCAIDAIAVDTDGSVFIIGQFSRIAGQARRNLAKLGADGTYDPQWDPRLTYSARLVSAAHGVVTLAGFLYGTDGFASQNIVRVASAGTGATITSFHSPLAPGDEVLALALDADDNAFAMLDGASSRRVVKLRAQDGAFATGFTPIEFSPTHPSAPVQLLASGNAVFVGGDFAASGAAPLQPLAKFDASSGARIAAWAPPADGLGADAIALSPDGLSLVAALAVPNTYPALTRLDRFDAAGIGAAVPGAAQTLAGAKLAAVAAQSAGAVAGYRLGSAASGTALARYAAGGLDAGFVADVRSAAIVFDVIVGPGDDIYVGGSFTRIGSVLQPWLARLGADGTVDLGWRPGLDGTVLDIALDGTRLYAAGQFATAGGQPHATYARFDTQGDGGVDAWQPVLGQPYIGGPRVVPDGAGSVYLAGLYADVPMCGGTPRSMLVHVSGSEPCTLDGAFNSALQLASSSIGFIGWVDGLVADGAGKLYVTGYFTMPGQGGVPLSLARINASGSADNGWNPVYDWSSQVSAIALGPDALYASALDWGAPRTFLRRYSLANGVRDFAWDSPLEITANQLSFASPNELYVAGRTIADVRGGLWRVDRESGQVDSSWQVTFDGPQAFGFAVPRPDTAYAVGDFVGAGGKLRVGFAAYGTAADTIFADSYETR